MTLQVFLYRLLFYLIEINFIVAELLKYEIRQLFLEAVYFLYLYDI